MIAREMWIMASRDFCEMGCFGVLFCNKGRINTIRVGYELQSHILSILAGKIYAIGFEG